jgi:hypothetical protein
MFIKQRALDLPSNPGCAHRDEAGLSDYPMLPRSRMPLIIALTFASGPRALAHDAAWSRAVTPTEATVVDQSLAQAHGLDVSRTAWPAPVGHRQPRAEDIPAEDPKKRESDRQIGRLDRAVDDKLTICRGC